MMAAGDLDGDGAEDTAVVYTLEGAHHGNGYEQFLVVRSSRPGGRFLDVVAGLKEVGAILALSIAAGRVELAVLEYGPSDASCCPSRPATTNYTLTGGALIESKPK